MNLSQEFWRYFIYIIGVSWLVGVGRYWDHPNAYWWQYAGLGSIAYIFALSFILFIVVWPLKPQSWSYKSVLVFVGLTALPGLLYAIPVELFMALKTAQLTNVWFLAIVAAWRVALLIKFLVSAAKLNWFKVAIATVLPLSAIVFLLASFNLEHVVFNLMAGIREEDASPYDAAYSAVFFLTFIAFTALPISVICYVFAILNSRTGGQKQGR